MREIHSAVPPIDAQELPPISVSRTVFERGALMAVTAGRSTLTAQTVGSSYETVFEASAPTGAGSNGSPVGLFTFTGAVEAQTLEITRFGGQLTEYPLASGATKQFGCFRGGIVKVRCKSTSGAGTLLWEDTIR